MLLVEDYPLWTTIIPSYEVQVVRGNRAKRGNVPFRLPLLCPTYDVVHGEVAPFVR